VQNLLFFATIKHPDTMRESSANIRKENNSENDDVIQRIQYRRDSAVSFQGQNQQSQ